MASSVIQSGSSAGKWRCILGAKILRMVPPVEAPLWVLSKRFFQPDACLAGRQPVDASELFVTPPLIEMRCLKAKRVQISADTTPVSRAILGLLQQSRSQPLPAP